MKNFQKGNERKSRIKYSEQIEMKSCGKWQSIVNLDFLYFRFFCALEAPEKKSFTNKVN